MTAYDSDAALLKSAATIDVPGVTISARRLAEALRSMARAASSGSPRALDETTRDVDAARESLCRAMRGGR